MNTRNFVIVAAALFTFGCSDGGAKSVANGGSCITPTTVFSGLDAYDALSVRDGFVYVEIPGSGIARCETSGCTLPTSILESDSFISSALGASSAMYTTQIASDDDTGVTGALRSIGVDGTGDQSVLAGLDYPAYVATSGARTFWAHDSFALDETPATINCIGCSGTGSTPWIGGLTGGTYGMLADANNVYVLADDPTQTSITLFACSITTPCFAEPRIVIANLDSTMMPAQIASDGTNVYVARASLGDVVRIDGAGAITTVVTSEIVTALTVAPDTGDLYYGTIAGEVGRVKSDGSESTTLACSSNAVTGLAVDAASVYMLTGASSSDVLRAPK